MKTKLLIALLALSIGAVLVVSVATLRGSRRELVREFDGVQQRLARETATALAAHLSAFDRDGTLLANLVERTRRAVEVNPLWQRREILAACQALATTVSHYRTIGVFGPDQVEPIVAIDPIEDQASTADLLVEASAALGREVAVSRRAAWRGPLLIGAVRAFYLYGVPAGGNEAVVLTADVALLLEDVLRPIPRGTRHVVSDGGSTLWTDCETAATCRRIDPPVAAPPPPVSIARGGARGRGSAVEAPPAALIDRLTPAAAVVQAMAGSEDTVLSTTQPLTTPLGAWSMILHSSTAAIDTRQRALVWQLVLTSAAVVVAMLSVGVFIVRQQRTAATLETELRGARALAHLRERSDKILDNISVGIVGATRAGRMVFANQFLQQQRGFPGVTGGDGGQVGGEALDRWTASLRPDIERSLAHGRTGLVSRASEAGSRDKAGPALDVRVVPLEHPVDDVAALILVEDLSELHRLRRDLVRAEKLITVGVLTAGIAHEIGTPLMVIRGQAEHLLEKIGDTQAAPGLEAIVSQIDRIAATISRVLEFSRAQPLQVQPTSLPQAVSRAAELLEWRLRAKRLSLRVRSPAEVPPVAADPLQLEQVLVNLLMNACDASSEEGAIDVSTTRPNGHSGAGAVGQIRIEISDSGSGIRPEDIHAIFDPYFTTKRTGEGTGLGLTIVAQIVHSHRGEIAVASTPGRGTTVSVLWPVAAAGGALAS